jgi:hypothetical protein
MSYSKKSSKKVTKNRETYTSEQQTLISGCIERKKKAIRPIEFQCSGEKDGSKLITNINDNTNLEHPTLIKTTGTVYPCLGSKLLEQATLASSSLYSEDDQVKTINLISSAMLDLSPRDYMEGMLSAQILATHNQAMECLKRAMIKDQSFEIATSYRNQAIKLLRTYTAQMEALNKYRTGGQQKMIIEHVHIHKGGQAIVGSVTQRGEGCKDKK